MLRLIGRLPETPEMIDFVRRFVGGAYDYEGVDRSCMERRATLEHAYDFVNIPDTRLVLALLVMLDRHGQLDFELFDAATRHFRYLLPRASGGWKLEFFAAQAEVPPDLDSKLHEWSTTILRRCLAGLKGDDERRRILAVALLSGPEFLLAAAQLHRDRKLDKLRLRREGSELTDEEVAVHLARARNLEPAKPDERAALVEQLRAFPPATLKRLLPLADAGRDLLLDALGWGTARPIVTALVADVSMPVPLAFDWTETNPDPTRGVVDVRGIRSAIVAVGEGPAREICRLFREAAIGANDNVLLVEAAAGWNAAAVRERARKRSQPALRAFALLPLERGMDEAFERYEWLTEFKSTGKQFGQQKRASEAAAYKAALTNLARNAGFDDELRFIWAIERRIAGDSGVPEPPREVGGATVAVVLSGAGPELAFTSDGKPVKSVPAALKGTAELKAAQAAKKQMDESYRRTKASLEMLMTEGSALGAAEVEGLLKHPMVGRLLPLLILRRDNGAYGIIAPDGRGLEGIGGAVTPVEGPVRVAHVFDLHRDGLLPAWQQEVLRRKLVQPFKQAFRELYIVTPAELESRTRSNRFAGRTLVSKLVAGVLSSRGWYMRSYGDLKVPAKDFPGAGLRALFEFQGFEHFVTEEESVVSDAVFFEPMEGRWKGPVTEGHAMVPLGDVPPLVFSEVMRDADLIVSVAIGEGEQRISSEAYQARGDLVRGLIEGMQLAGVAIEGHYAHVKGTRGNYRVHLGTAAIYRDPGNYVCIVPAKFAQRESFYLPFADEGPSNMSEVISKVLLLVHDDKIEDQSILAQLRISEGGAAGG